MNLKWLFFRGRHLYGPKMVSEYVEKHNTIYPGSEIEISQEFPGDHDQGTPMVMEENGRFTIIGIFLRQGKKVAVYSQINVESRLWIQATKNYFNCLHSDSEPVSLSVTSLKTKDDDTIQTI